jgi:hypothetical protein
MYKKDAINHFGSAANLAAALKITKGSISQWGDKVPPLRAYQLAELIKTPRSANEQQYSKAS